MQKREKIFGAAPGIPLDRNAKARIMAYARSYNVRRKTPRRQGPITRAAFDVLQALLWGFHNNKTGQCFPGYQAVADKAGCHRDTVAEAIKALEHANVLTWSHRLMRVRHPDGRRQVIRTSNAYAFRDPLPCAIVRNPHESESPTGTGIPAFSFKESRGILVLDPTSTLDSALIRLGRAMGALPEAASA